MNTTITGVAIIELSAGHEEVMYALAKMLEHQKIPVLLICTPKLKKRLAQLPISHEVFWFEEEAGLWNFYRQTKSLTRLLREKGVSHLIFNTASNTEIRNLLLFGLGKFNCTGVLHYGPKLKESFTQKQISFFIKKYMVPARFIAENMKPFPRGIRVSEFYPVFMPEFSRANVPAKGNGEIWITVPGQVETKRRDYDCIIELFQKQEIPGHVKIIMTGPAFHNWGYGNTIMNAIPEAVKSGQLMMFQEDLTWPEFIGLNQQADLIWPLAHPGKGSFPQYSQWQISGAYNLAYGLKKPLLMHEYFKRYDEFSNFSVFYNLDSLPDILANLMKRHAEREQIIRNIVDEEKFTLDFQSEKLINMLKA